MIIKQVEIDSFLGIKSAVLKFNQLNIIAGENWAGKSSIQQALRLALTGEVARVKLKGQYPLLIKDGAKKATINAFFDDGEFNSVMIPSSGTAQIPNCDDAMLKIALDQQRFINMTEAERRKVVFSINPQVFNQEKVAKRMLELDADNNLLEEVLPMLVSGFDVAEAEAELKCKQYRAEWKAITGETYGSEKAAKWESNADVESLRCKAQQYAKIASERNDINAKITDQQIVVEKARDKLLLHTLAYKCEECGHQHKVDEAKTAKLKEQFDLENGALNFINTALLTLNKDLAECDAAAVSLKSAEKDAADTTEAAQQAHANVVAWAHIKQLLSADGVMAELVIEALKPINARLRKSAEISGFAQVSLLHDMSVTVDNRLYGLCSESQQWIAQAMLCEALAYIAGFNLVILDRIDVLSVKNRGALVHWCNQLCDDVQFILFGTLKGKPSIEGAMCYWVENGGVV